MPDVVLLALGLVAFSALGCAPVLLVRRLALPSAVLVAVAGLLLVAPAVARVRGGDVPTLLWVLAAVQAGAAALLAYPRLSLRSPADLIAVSLAGAGLVTVLTTLVATPTRAGTRDGLAWGATVAVVVVVGLHTWWRLERADADGRRVLLWMALPVAVVSLTGGVLSFVQVGLATLVTGVLGAAVPPCLLIGVARPQVVDVRALVVRAVVLAAALLGYVALLACLQALTELLTGRAPDNRLTLVLAALCALAVGPTQVVMRGVVDAVLFGRRPDPLSAASAVAGTIGDDPAAALDAVRDALVLPYAAIRLDDTVVAQSGVDSTSTRSQPLPLDSGRKGELVVGLRPGDLTLSGADEDVLRLVAPLLAQTFRAQAVAAEVASSREAVIQAVEEERRRVRRDLHDGLGPVLSGIAFTTDAARNTLRADPQTADNLLAGLRAQAVAAIGSIRRLVYGMRPPALDELGLLPALQQYAVTLGTPANQRFTVAFEAPDLPAMPAAWEVATYRIVAAALDNAARHSGAPAVTARLAVTDGTLLIEVADDGRAPAVGWRPGVGLASMRERAAELGGTLTIDATPQGWTVRAAIPLPADRGVDEQDAGPPS